jgi:type IV pilus assembly protein PilB
MTLLPFPKDSPPPSTARPLLGEILCAQGALTEDQLRIALQEQRLQDELLGRLLVKLRLVDEGAVQRAICTQTGLPPVDLAQALVDVDAAGCIDRETCLALGVAPLTWGEGELCVAMADPQDVRAVDHLRRILPPGMRLSFKIARESELAGFIARAYGGAEQPSWLAELGQQPVAGMAAVDHPVVKSLNTLLEQAVNAGASDIHLEPEEQSVRVRIRVDGILKVLNVLHREPWPMLLQRLKVMAGMDIVDTRHIQDGRFHLRLGGRAVDFRASILPTQHGENMVIRVLDGKRALLPLEKLGFNVGHQKLLRELAMKPEGMLVITGPTGSGKTTTLYALLQLLNTETRNVMTLEDPIEYQLDRIRQTQVRENFGLSFAEGVRAILRQDPDVVLIGEIRDPDTAQMALRAAMTGSQVFTTLHTQDCFGVFPRLKEFGLSSGLMSGNIIGVVAQRLVRGLCTACRKKSGNGWQAAGCGACEHSGYKGRGVVSEVLVVDAALDELIMDGAPRQVLLKTARENGFISLAEDGMAKRDAGIISHESLVAEVDISSRRVSGG